MKIFNIVPGTNIKLLRQMKGNSINNRNSFIKFIIPFGVTILITRPEILQTQLRHSLCHLNNYSIHNTTQKQFFPMNSGCKGYLRGITCSSSRINKTSQAVWTVYFTFHSWSHTLHNPQHFQQLPALTLKGVLRFYDPYHNSAPRKCSVECTWITEGRNTNWMTVLAYTKQWSPA
jgi:hypothetical protein